MSIPGIEFDFIKHPGTGLFAFRGKVSAFAFWLYSIEDFISEYLFLHSLRAFSLLNGKNLGKS